MKKIILIIAVTILVVVLSYVLFLKNKEPENTATEGVMDEYLGVVVSENSTFNLQTQDGGTLPVKNFLKNDDIYKDPQNQGYLYLGNAFPESIQDPYPDYVVTYIYDTQYFNVTLLKEPLYAARSDAENYLKQTLNLNDKGLCQLKYTVSVPAYVNEEKSGIDFRFSFCPDATAL